MEFQMTAPKTSQYLGISLLGLGILIGYLIARVQPATPVSASQSSPDIVSAANVPAAPAQESANDRQALSPTKATANRDMYFPGTEDLKPDEMRITALGTGMPSARPKQAAACFLVELGNGDKFLFDIGSGSHERIAAQKIPYDYLNKVFIGHLHVDHFGDLPTFWLGGTVMNRLVPLRIWGPSGSTRELGTKYCLEKMKEMYQWDIGTRSGVVDFRGGELEVHEFPFDGINKVIYDENSVVIRSFPAVHGLDGAVSFVLEWNGMKFVYGSDTYPNKWYIEHSAGADLAIHECFLPPPLLVTKQGFSPLEALTVGTQGHTSPEQFGKVMSLVKPRIAVGYHFYNDFDVEPEVRRRVRTTYDGPLSLAVDYMVWNVTKDDIKIRMAAKDEDVWPSPPLLKKISPDFTKSINFSKFTLSGREAFPEVVEPLYDEINKIYGTDFKPMIGK
jgi:ribonuclease Z